VSQIALIISIQPKFANMIFSGEKTVELRKTKPKKIQKGSLALVYVSSPTKALVGVFEIDSILERPVDELWDIVKKQAGISKKEFNTYYRNTKTGTGIFLNKPRELLKPIGLAELREKSATFMPPQSFRYATPCELSLANRHL
jgi:predicted transcriptional regulator